MGCVVGFRLLFQIVVFGWQLGWIQLFSFVDNLKVLVYKRWMIILRLCETPLRFSIKGVRSACLTYFLLWSRADTMGRPWRLLL